jgi:hypothetical protein
VKMQISPSDILYSQDSISYRFTDGKTLEETFRLLLNEKLAADDIEPIDVVKDDSGRWWALHGNRRLFLYKMLKRFGLIDLIPVRNNGDVSQQFVREKFSTKTEGMSIRVREDVNNPQLEATLETLSEEYQGERILELELTNTEHSPVEYLDYLYSDYDELYE